MAMLGVVALIVGLSAGLVLATLDPFTLLFYGAYAATGVFLVVRRPLNPIGRVLLAIAWGFLGTSSTAPAAFVAALKAAVISFAERLRDEVDMSTVTVDLARTTRAALAPEALTIWLRETGR